MASLSAMVNLSAMATLTAMATRSATESLSESQMVLARPPSTLASPIMATTRAPIAMATLTTRSRSMALRTDPLRPLSHLASVRSASVVSSPLVLASSPSVASSHLVLVSSLSVASSHLVLASSPSASKEVSELETSAEILALVQASVVRVSAIFAAVSALLASNLALEAVLDTASVPHLLALVALVRASRESDVPVSRTTALPPSLTEADMVEGAMVTASSSPIDSIKICAFLS